MLKLASTEAQLQIDFEYNREMMVGGVATLLSGVLVGSPAYSQTKFNVLNHAMTHSTTVVTPTLVCALFNGVLFFSGFPLINCAQERGVTRQPSARASEAPTPARPPRRAAPSCQRSAH